MFLRQIAAVFLDRTSPDSSIEKPAAIHMTSAPQIRNENVLKTNAVSAETSAAAGVAVSATGMATRAASPIPLLSFAASLLNPIIIASSQSLERVRVGFAGADADRPRHVQHENLAIADPAGIGRFLDRFDDG